MSNLGHDAFVNSYFADWLYSDYDDRKYRLFTTLYGVPGVRDYMDYLLDYRSDQEYMERYGMDYSDIHDPRKLRSTSSGARLVGHAINMVSKNLEKLYDE